MHLSFPPLIPSLSFDRSSLSLPVLIFSSLTDWGGGALFHFVATPPIEEQVTNLPCSPGLPRSKQCDIVYLPASKQTNVPSPLHEPCHVTYFFSQVHTSVYACECVCARSHVTFMLNVSFIWIMWSRFDALVYYLQIIYLAVSYF